MANIIYITQYEVAVGHIIHVLEIDGKNKGIREKQSANFTSRICVDNFEVEIVDNRPPTKVEVLSQMQITLADVQLALDIANYIHPHISYSEE